MKMAKATHSDMDAAIGIAGILDGVSSGYYPPAPMADGDEAEPALFDPDNAQHRRALHDRLIERLVVAPGGLNRVVWGFHTIMHNDICDPAADTLELHPRLAAALSFAADHNERARACQSADTAPETEALIERVMAAFPRDTAKQTNEYFQAVHQELAPLARKIEIERNAMETQIAGLTQALAHIAAECSREAGKRPIATRIYRAIADQRLPIPLATPTTAMESLA